MRTAATTLFLPALLLAGCDPDWDPPAATARDRCTVVDARFTADGKALFGRAVPPDKDPAARPRVGEYVLWDAATGRVLRRLPLDEKINSYKPGSADGKGWVAFGTPSGVNSRFLLFELDPKPRAVELPGSPKSATRPTFTADFRRMAYSDKREGNEDYQGHIYDLDVQDWKKLASVPGRYATLSPDGQRVATVTEGPGLGTRRVRVWSLAEGKELWQAPARAYSITFTADGKYLVESIMNSHQLYDAATGKEKVRVDLSDDGHAACAGGKMVTVGTARNTVSLEVVSWDVETGRELDRRRVIATPGTLLRLKAAPFSTTRLAFPITVKSQRSPRGGPGFIDVWTVEVLDPASPNPLTSIRVPSSMSGVLVSPDGRTLAALTYGGPWFYRLP